MARQEGALCSQLCSYKFCQGDLLFLGGVTQWIPKDQQPERDTFPQSPETSWWSFVLPLVQEGGAEWGHHDKPPLYWSLPPRINLQKVSTVLYNQFQCNEMPCAGVWTNSCPWWQFEQWGARCQGWWGQKQTHVIALTGWSPPTRNMVDTNPIHEVEYAEL